MALTKALTDSDHISAVDAGRQFGYTNDYITRLAREKKVIASRVGKQWYVDAKSLEAFVAHSKQIKKAHAEQLRMERKRERIVEKPAEATEVTFVPLPNTRASALAKAGMVVSVVAMIGGFLFAHVPYMTEEKLQSANILTALRDFATRLYGLGEAPVATPEVGVRVQESASDSTPEGASLARVLGSTTTAVAVIPPKDMRSTEEIAESFSDEVSVVRDADGTSGVITPVFKNSTGTPYRYLMVPMHRAESPP